MQNSTWRLRRLTVLSMLVALAYVMVLIGRVSIVPAAPFLQYEPKDVMLIIGGFLFGPVAGAASAVIVALMELVTGISTTGVIGLVMNILSSCSIVCTSAIIYQRRRTLSGAWTGLLCGVLVTTVVMLLWNYLITPLYMEGATREMIAGMLLPVFAPFNLLKGGINAALTMLLYKPISAALRKARLLPPAETNGKKSRFPVWLIAAFIAVSLVLITLAWNGII